MFVDFSQRVLGLGWSNATCSLASLLSSALFFTLLSARFFADLRLIAAILHSDLALLILALIQFESEGNLAVRKVLSLHVRRSQVRDRLVVTIFRLITNQLGKQAAAGGAAIRHVMLALALGTSVLGALHLAHRLRFTQFNSGGSGALFSKSIVRRRSKIFLSLSCVRFQECFIF